MEKYKDFSKLRPFTLSAVAYGEHVCDAQGNALSESAAVEVICSEGMDALRMLPAAWVAGAPVYHDTMLLDKRNGTVMRAEFYHELQMCLDLGILEISWVNNSKGVKK